MISFVTRYGIGQNGLVVLACLTNQNRRGVFEWQNGTLTPVFFPGAGIPGDEASEVISASDFRINSKGDYAVPVALTYQGASKTFLYLKETGTDTARLVLRDGDQYPVPGETKPLSYFRLADVPAVGGERADTSFNDRGQLLLELISTHPAKFGLFLLDTRKIFLSRTTMP